MQSPSTQPPAIHRGRKAYPLSSNQRRDEHALYLYACGHTAKTVMHKLNKDAEPQNWPPVFSERHVYRIIRAELLKKKCEWDYVGSEAGEREAVLSRMDATLEKMAVYLETNNRWAPGEESQLIELLLHWQLQQAQNRGYIDVPFRVQWERFPKVSKRHQRVFERAA